MTGHNEIKDISWISKKTKQDLEPEGLRQVLFAINEFVEQKLQLQAEIIAELQLVAAYKEVLVEKQVPLEDVKQRRAVSKRRAN